MEKQDENLVLWYNRPAKKWTEANPIGNGSLGGMIFGRTNNEEIQVNIDTLWSGYPRDMNNYEAKQYLQQARELILSGKAKEANDLIDKKMLGSYMDAYLNLGNIFINDLNPEKVSDYRRELDLTTATSTITYVKKGSGIRITRKTFASYPDNVIAIQIQASNPRSNQENGSKSLNLDLHLKSDIRHSTGLTDDGTLCVHYIHGQAPDFVRIYSRQAGEPKISYAKKKGVKFAAGVMVGECDGNLEVGKGGIKVRNASNIVIYFTAATNYVNYKTPPNESPINPMEKINETLKRVSARTFDEIYQSHLRDYGELFSRVKLDLGKTEPAALPTDVRIKRLRRKSHVVKMYLNFALSRILKKQTTIQQRDFLDSINGFDDPHLVTLLFQFGRYLLISSSREGTQPANLQGIWNNSLHPPWASNYTININTEMNYWPALPANLTECHEPLLRLIEELEENGKITAEVHYGLKGWCAHHNTTLWRNTNPTAGIARWAYWPNGAAWLAFSLWEHYVFTQDKDFLEKKAYPLMRGLVEFYLGWLFEWNGYYITCPATSPENSYLDKEGNVVEVSYATTCDMATIKQTFKNFRRICRELGKEDPFLKELDKIEPKLYPFKIGWDGILLEWPEDYDEPEPGHRHMSHLIGLHPGDLITPDETPELAAAVKKSIDKRVKYGGGATGWSCAWKINIYARLKDAINAYRGVATIIRNSTLPNLFNTHPPFQIDGNFGATAGILEMLIQSTNGIIEFLPACPSAWSKGSLKGVKVRGNCTVDLEWENGKVVKAKLMPHRTREFLFRLKNNYTLIEVSGESEGSGKQIPLKKMEKNIYSANLTEGKTYLMSRQ